MAKTPPFWFNVVMLALWPVCAIAQSSSYNAGLSPDGCDNAQVRAICGTPGLTPDNYLTAPHMNYGVNNPSFTFFRIEGDKCIRTTYGTACRAVCTFPKARCLPDAPAIPMTGSPIPRKR